MKIIKKINAFFAIILVCLPLLFIGLSSTAYAQVSAGSKSEVCTGIGAVGGDCSGNSGATLGKIISDIVQILLILIGAVAIIMIIIGGFKYVTSGGDPNNTNSAKNTIMYALIGLLIAAFAEVIVHFVLSRL